MSIKWNHDARPKQYEVGDVVQTRAAKLAGIITRTTGLVGFDVRIRFADGSECAYLNKWIERLECERLSSRDIHPELETSCDHCGDPVFVDDKFYPVGDQVACCEGCARKLLDC